MSTATGGVAESSGFASMMDKAVCVSVAFSKPGNYRKLRKDQYEVHADKTWVNASKQLIDCPELTAIGAHFIRVRRYIDSKCLPFPMQAGFRLLPKVLVKDVDCKLKEFQEELTPLVDAYCEVYPEEIKKAAKKLDKVFSPGDYLGVDAVRASIGIRYHYLTFGVDTALEAVDAQLFADEKAKLSAQITEAGNAVQQVLRVSMLTLLEKMKGSLEPGEDGKKKTFKNSLVANVTDFLKDVDARNITGDKELASISQKARDLLAGVPAPMLAQAMREDDGVRAEMAKSVGALCDQMSKLVIDKPTRFIELED